MLLLPKIVCIALHLLRTLICEVWIDEKTAAAFHVVVTVSEARGRPAPRQPPFAGSPPSPSS
eukprot:11123715-Heterocapsa_arctica.AAC.1